MAKQLGRALLVKIGDGEASEAFANLCGLNSKSFTINNSAIDVTTPNCTTPEGPLWTETLAGLKNVSVTGDGFFEDSATEARMNAVAMNADNARQTSESLCLTSEATVAHSALPRLSSVARLRVA
jgi:predicted secreted protein